MRDIDTLENRNIEISKYRKVIFKIPTLLFTTVASLAKVTQNVGFDSSMAFNLRKQWITKLIFIVLCQVWQDSVARKD